MQARKLSLPCRSAAAATVVLAGAGATFALRCTPAPCPANAHRRRRPHAAGHDDRPGVVVQAWWNPWQQQGHQDAASRQELETALLNISVEAPVDWPDVPPGSKLVVRPLPLEWRSQLSELLTDAFVDAAQLRTYRKLLRRRIGAYLEAQTGLLPRTVIFAALLRSPPPPAPPHPAPHAPELDASERSSNSNSVASVDDSGPPSTSTSTSQAEGWTNRDSAVGAAQPPPDAAGHAARLRPAQWSETLLGTAEVSFDRSTHSASLTLQPPRRAAYLCNMAVAGEWRRRGVGRHLIRAVEKACEVACEDELYLHLRFQDQPAAKLYEAAGFDTAASDPWLVVLLGQDRKRLMRKRVPTEAAVGGASAGPASVQQQQHLEEEQRVRG